MATELAKAYVQIVPSAEGIKGQISDALGDEPTKAGEKGGQEAGSSFGASMAKGIAAAAAAVTGAAVALVKGVVDGAKETAAFGDTIDKASQKIGMSTKAYQEWDYVLNLAGTNMQSMSAGMKTLTNKFDDAIGGSKTAQETFQRLGLSMEDISSMSREDLFKATITAFQGMEESAERAALANDLFGRSGQELAPLFNQTAEATQEQIDRANEYGMIMGEDLVKDSAAFVDAQTTLKGTITGLKNSLMGEFLPSLTSVTEGMAAFLAGDGGGLGMMQSGIQEFVNSLMANLPKVMEFGAGILQALGEGIIQNLPALIESAVQIIMQLTQTLLDNLPMLITAAMGIITALVQGLTEALPVLLGELPNIIQTVVLTLMDNLPALIECVTSLVVAIAEALPDIIMAIIEILPDLIVTVVMTLIDQIPVLIDCAIQVTAAIVKALPQIFMAIITALVKLVVELAGKLREKWVEFKKAAGEWISKIWSGIQEKWGTLIQNIVKFFKQIPQKIGEALRNIGEVGKNLVKGLWNGITNVTSWVLDKIKGFGKSILNGIKKIFGIGSPSKEMAYFGEMLDAGLAQGIERNTKPISNAIDDITAMTTQGFSSDIGVSSSVDVNGSMNGMAQLVQLVAALSEKVDNLKVYLDGDALVGGISDRMDTALGANNGRKARGLA